jgi:hypothetical protein
VSHRIARLGCGMGDVGFTEGDRVGRGVLGVILISHYTRSPFLPGLPLSSPHLTRQEILIDINLIP